MDAEKEVGAQTIADICTMLTSYQTLITSFMNNIEADVKAIRSQFRTLGTELENLRNEIKTHMRNADRRVEVVESCIENLKDRSTTMECSIVVLGERVTVLEQKVKQYIGVEKEDTKEIKI